MMKFQIRLVVAILVLGFGLMNQAQAWGRRGHSIVCQTAAAVLAAKTTDGSADFLKEHSFDLGFYCNVPDFIWKRQPTYEIEHPQHYMDLDLYDRELKAAAVTGDPFALSRLDFEKKYPTIDVKAGRSFWRIQELLALLNNEVQILKQPTVPQASLSERAKHQENWLVTAGEIGHYVGDLSQPLHVTENFDGQSTNQKGIHSYFEDTVVDQLSSTDRPGSLEAAIGRDAVTKWPAFHKASASRTELQLLEDLSRLSLTRLPALLKADRAVGRGDLKKAAAAYEPMIQAEMTSGALTVAEIWSRQLGWKYNGVQFFNFNGLPDYVYPPGTQPASTPKSQPQSPPKH